MDQIMKKVVEASYLTADSAAQYRVILRFFYRQHERMRDFISPEEVLEYLRSLPAFHDYEEEQLHQQLAQLVKWNNLVARQDMTNAKTIEEYKKKRFRYQCTPYTVEIERMLIQLEKLGDQFQGSLERSQFDRLLASLAKLEEELKQPLDKPAAHYMHIWDDIFHFFGTIRTNTADYIAYINSEKTSQRMQTEAFLVYKNQFTAYLRDFIVSLQKTSLQIRERLRELDTHILAPLFEKLVEHRRQIPRLEDTAASAQEWLEEFREYWESLRRWFLGASSSQSELEMLQMQTNEMIRRMARYVQRISERQQHFRSRKKDYLHLSKWFAGCHSLEEAHQLSSVVFGTMTVRHLHLEEATTDNLHAETWEEQPEMREIKPRTNRYREKTKPGAFRSNHEQKEKQRLAYLKEREQEKQLIEKYMKNGEIRLAEIGIVEPFVRKVLLGWIGKSMAAKNHEVKTDYGMSVKVVIDPDRIITLDAEDGKLIMPDAVFELSGGER
ncbi:TIGR02677 family protein [Heyndrickxia coagulans]|nr:TIGR02677 family protein [Heyndrickxia coagulans]MCR2845745.1 TIGR02677 family protein [Heyndrickxia coagulans]MDR4223357.1 TIGR02677 family protein [Heyndrickxia coagulans DSM 1 = ATCC 7050]MED4494522.1 TIGR02677 family protein [Heyndrickxia coagulans]MED4535340.1 TIGR02677 family protein [Heyndrickxia coagulans]QJE32504.1 TIGR02677 family protein [Heyndrickxia coagulans]